MSRRAVWVLCAVLCWIATACASTTSPESLLRREQKARDLGSRGRWAESLQVSERALARCNQIPWCKEDKRFQGAFYNSIGTAEEHLDHRNLALQHYRKAFNSYPLFFSENYFRLLKELGMLRLLRSEIDVKLASQEAGDRSVGPTWISPDRTGCSGRSLAGSYSWRMKADSGGGALSGKAVVFQSGCLVSADLTPAAEQAGAGQLRLRGNIGTGAVSILVSPPCMSTDKGLLAFLKNGFTVSGDRAAAVPGCLSGHYLMEFAKD